MPAQMLALESPLELTAAADKGGPPRVRIVAYAGGSIRPGGWGDVVIDLAGLKMAAQVPLLADHDSSLAGIVGHGSPKIEGGKLIVDGTLVAGLASADHIASLARAGVSLQASVGVDPGDILRLREGESAVANGKAFKAGPRGLSVLKAGVLREISIVALGADSATRVDIKAKGKNMPQVPPVTEGEEQAEKDPVQLERERIAAIVKATANFPKIRDQAISEGWDENKAALEALRASRDFPFAITGGGRIQLAGNGDALQAAVLCHMGRDELAVKALGEQAAQMGRDLRANSMVDLCRAALELEHRTIPSDRDGMIRASLSTMSLPEALSGAANRVLIEAYMDSPSTWRSFAAIRSADDFREHKAIRPSMTGGLEQIAKGGEFKHAGLGESMFDFSVDTFGKMLTIDRKDIINDNLGFFEENAAAMGKMAARSLSDLVYSVLLANAGNFFHTSNANYAEGAGTALSVTSLGAGIATMMAQRDSEGRDLDIRPRVLLVPPELRQTAIELLQSEFIERAANLPTGNALKGAVTLQVEPRLSNSTRFTGTSAKAWYLFSAPQDAALIVAFLYGRQAPTVEFFGFDSDPATLAATWRVYADYGAKLGDPKGAYRAKGEA